VRPSLAATLPVFEKYQQLVHRHAPSFIRHVLDGFRQHTLSAVQAAARLGLSPTFLMWFGAGREEQPIHEIQAGDLELWIDNQVMTEGWGFSTKRTYMLLFSSLWSVAIAKGWARLNIVDRLEPVGKITVKP
jgi:hypothetical protein